MALTSITVNGLQVEGVAVFTTYAVGHDTLLALAAGDPRENVMVEMQDRPPSFIRHQAQARTIPLTVYLRDPDALQRRDDYEALKTALAVEDSLILFEWTEDAVDYELRVSATELVPASWFQRASAQLTAPDPTPAIV